MQNIDRCVVCGEYVPEGGQVCKLCEEREPSFDVIRIRIMLNKITDISEFVQLASECTDDVMVKQGRWTVSAKSLMGVMCLNLSEPVTVEFYGYVPYKVRDGMDRFIAR